MKDSKGIIKNLLIGMAGVIFLTCLDQFTKILAVKYLMHQPSMEILPGIFELTYLENRGAAWGILKNQQWIFLIATALISSMVIYLYVKSIPQTRYRIFRILCVILLAGAFGNAYDRLFRGYVIDFFYFSLIDFPVFNVADCFVTMSIAAGLLIYREEVLRWMKSES